MSAHAIVPHAEVVSASTDQLIRPCRGGSAAGKGCRTLAAMVGGGR